MLKVGVFFDSVCILNKLAYICIRNTKTKIMIPETLTRYQMKMVKKEVDQLVKSASYDQQEVTVLIEFDDFDLDLTYEIGLKGVCYGRLVLNAYLMKGLATANNGQELDFEEDETELFDSINAIKVEPWK